MLKKILLILVAALSLGYMFGLTAGDIAILGVNTDATKSMVFVALADIPAATDITFTDNAWDATNQVWRTGEGSIVWSTASALSKGTVVTITLATTFTVDIGSVTTNVDFVLAGAGDQILAYAGTTAPITNADAIWLYGFSTENWVWGNNSNTSDIPTALTGANVGLTSSTTEVDNGYFANGSTAQTTVSVTGTKAALLALFGDNSKYYPNNTGPLTFPTYSVTVSAGTTPLIIASGTLNTFTTYTGTPSASQSYTLTGSNLTAGIVVTPPAGFAISTDNSTFYTTAQTLASTYNGLVYVRLTGTTAGSYSGNITHTSTGATQVDKAVSGTVSDPVPLLHTTGTLAAFNTYVGTPSAAQTYTLYGEYLTAGIVVTPPAGFAISTDNSTFYTTAQTLASNFNGLIYVRLTGTTVGTYSGNITHTSTGATQVDLAASGEVFAPAVPTLFMEENFAYPTGTALTTVGWTAHSSAGTNPILVSDTGLTYTNYPPVLNYSATMATSGEDINRTFSAQALGNVYSSLLINVTSAQTTGDYFYHLSSSPLNTQHYRGRVFIQKDSATDNFRIGIANGGAVGTAVWTGYNYVYGQTYLLLLKYEMVPGANNDLVHLWVNPDFSGAEPAPLLTATDAITSEPANIGSVILRQGSATATAALKVDGIRVTNDWAKLWAPAATPVISATGTPALLANIVGNPSEEVTSYQLSGSNLLSTINIVAPTHFEISLAAASGYASTLQVPADFNGTIYVRLNSSVVGEHSGDITHNSTGAQEVLMRVDGETFPADVTWNVTGTLTAFTQTVGTPSANQSYNLSATNATGDITVSVGAPFELSTTGTGAWSTSLTLAYNFNASIYVRLNSALAGSFNGTIMHATANATNYELPVSGEATPPAGNYTDELFISEYIEGGSNNKAIEIYNGTGVPVDLMQYSVKLGANGAAFGTTLTWTTSTILAHDDVYVIANAASIPAILSVADTTSTVTYYNGDDAVGLFKNNVLIDIIGIELVDPGTAWDVAGVTGATLNHTLIRKPTIVQGNTDWASSAGTTAANSEWIVQPQDYITDLGIHTFSGDLPVAASPTFAPPAGVYTSAINVALSSTTPGASIFYTLDGTVPSLTNGYEYENPIPVSTTTTIKAIAFATGFSDSYVSEALYIFPTDVATIAELRAGTPGVYYRLTGVGVITFQQTYRNQKFIQDATAGILIDDLGLKISTVYNRYDGLRYLVGTVSEYGGMKQFVPAADPGAPFSTGNVITPPAITLNELVTNFEMYESELVKVMGITFDTADGALLFADGLMYPMNTATMNFRTTFYGMDYIGTIVPTAQVNVIGIPNSRVAEGNLFTARELADFQLAGPLPAPVVTIAQAGGIITLSWGAVAGASYYKVESADDPFGVWTVIVPNTTNLTYTEAAATKKFYRVSAF